MNDYIERKYAVCVALGSKSLGNTAYSDRFEIASRLRNLPAADVRPVVWGKWSWRSSINVPTWCLECGFLKPIDDERKYNFCPNCGADMREPPKEE